MSYNQVNIERAVLASYLLIGDTEDAFKSDCREKLDRDIFIVPFHKRIADKINVAIDTQEPLPFTFCMIQDKIIGTSYEDDLLLIEATNPLSENSGLKWYINYLKQNKVERMFGNE